MRCGKTLAGVFAVIPFGLLVAQPQHPATVDFDNDIRPIVVAHCAKCHMGDQKQGGLSLETGAAVLKGGESGPAAIPGNADKSVLLRRILGLDAQPRMPMGFGPLSEHDTSQIREWIAQGAKAKSAGKRIHWAYVPPVRPKLPKVSQPAWVHNSIDAFVLSRLDREHLHPSPPADRTTLIRRVTLDLTGLPPSTSEVRAFLADNSSNAYDKVVDRLLASPHFGEKMALPWLDAARYADSNGFQQDGDTFQYVWRDWVVRAFNANMPFDQFTIQQLAGDLLPTQGLSRSEIQDRQIATAFNRNHMLNGEGGAIPEEQRNVGLFDRVDTTSTTWLGLTMTCARCHDHKYDPLTQKDYYSLLAFFNNVPETGAPTDTFGSYYLAKPWVMVGTDAQMDELQKFEASVAAAKSKDEKAAAEKKLNDAKALLPKVMVMSDAQPRSAHIYSRGNYEAPLSPVSPSTPDSLPKMKPEWPKNRLGLAKWIMSPENPLTARVQVNRFWQALFGHGLVKSPENFGVQCETPVYPDLLDWLAVEFRDSGWNVKHLLKLIVTSSVYRQSSVLDRKMAVIDPSNRFLSRGGRFRMPSPILRDVALTTSGLIDLKMGGKPVYPYQPKAIWDGLNITDERDFSYPQSSGSDLYRRSIYTFWRRTVGPGDMFDASSRQVCTVRMPQTSTPLHALTMLNDVVWVEAGRGLAQRVMKASASSSQRLKSAFELVCARTPNSQELKVLERMLSRSLSSFRADPSAATAYLRQGELHQDPKLNGVELAAYGTVCQAIYNLDEAMTHE